MASNAAKFTHQAAQIAALERKMNVVMRDMKDLKELRFKIGFRQGLLLARDREGLSRAVYRGDENAKRRNKNITLPELHKTAHANRSFPRKTGKAYANAVAHIKHRDSPGSATSSVFKKGQTTHLRRFKTVVNRGNGIPWGKMIQKQTTTPPSAPASNTRRLSNVRTGEPPQKRPRR